MCAKKHNLNSPPFLVLAPLVTNIYDTRHVEHEQEKDDQTSNGHAFVHKVFVLQQLTANLLLDTFFKRGAHLPLQLCVLLEIVLDNFAHWRWYAQECGGVHVDPTIDLKKSTYILELRESKMASSASSLITIQKRALAAFEMWSDDQNKTTTRILTVNRLLTDCLNDLDALVLRDNARAHKMCKALIAAILPALTEVKAAYEKHVGKKKPLIKKTPI